MESKSEYENYLKASKKVKEIKGFYIHLLCYVLVISFLVFINLKYSPIHLWFIYPLAGWGIGLIGHAIGVFGTDMLFSKNWEQRKIKEFMEEEKRKNTNL
ncbi:2TM domain-containing protein [Flavobacterium sp.]|uniref:2TM domain-containing protein n=1 Tax=Flavobacterium sp. TaxID=239 RepID=UPI003527B2CA